MDRDSRGGSPKTRLRATVSFRMRFGQRLRDNSFQRCRSTTPRGRRPICPCVSEVVSCYYDHVAPDYVRLIFSHVPRVTATTARASGFGARRTRYGIQSVVIGTTMSPYCAHVLSSQSSWRGTRTSWARFHTSRALSTHSTGSMRIHSDGV